MKITRWKEEKENISQLIDQIRLIICLIGRGFNPRPITGAVLERESLFSRSSWTETCSTTGS